MSRELKQQIIVNQIKYLQYDYSILTCNIVSAFKNYIFIFKTLLDLYNLY